ncbi:MAG: ABC transporter permease [Chloroflexota bacterium]
MGRYVLARIASSLVILLVTSLVTFSLIRLAPGDPVAIMFGPTDATGLQEGLVGEAAMAQVRARLGLDQPAPIQYAIWLMRVVSLDFGTSFRSRQPVAEELGRRLPSTLLLAGLTFGLEVALAIGLGLLSAVRRGSMADHLIRLLSLAFVAMPAFWLGLLLLYLFAVQVQWVAVGGPATLTQAILPALTLALTRAPRVMRVLRASLLDELSQLYVTLGRAKGLSEPLLLARHALPNALLPSVSLLGLSLGGLVAGSVVVETVFSWPGIGKLVADSIAARDYPIVQGYVLFVTASVVGISLCADLLHAMLDPRIRLGGGAR